MGCGASSIYAKDGTIAPGKGEGGFQAQFDVTNVYIWAGADGDKAQLQLRNIPEDPKLLKEAKFVNQGAEVGPLAPVTLTTKAGLRQARWALATPEGAVAKKYPSFEDLKLPQSLFAAHKVDEKKHPENLVKAGKQKDKEHVYTKDADKATKDIEACEKFVNPGQMHDDMNVYKDSMVTVEDSVVQSQANTIASVTYALGMYAEEGGELQMGIPEKAKKAVEDKKNCDKPMQANLMKAVDGKNQATTAIYKGAVMGAAKAMGLEPEQLVPGLDGQLAVSLGTKPYCEPYDKIATFDAKGELPTPEDYPGVVEAKCKALLESDGADEEAIRKKEADGAYVKEFEEKVRGMMEYAVNATKALDKGAITQGKRVLARWCAEGQAFGFQEGEVNGAVGNAVWYENADAKPEPIKKEGECVSVKFDDGSSCLVPVEHIAEEKTEAAKEGDLVPGYPCRAKFYGECYLDATVAGPKNKDGSFPMNFDPVFSAVDVKPEDIRPPHDVDKIASMPHLLYRQVNDLTAQWLDADEKLTVKVNIWRECAAPDTKQTFDLKPFQNKKKDEKGNETSQDVHGGYKTTVSLLQGRSYRYNFEVTKEGGEAEFFADFGKKCEATGSKGFKYTVSA